MTPERDSHDAQGQSGVGNPDAPDPNWPATLARAVADQIKFWRGERKFSAQQLALRTKDLGHYIPRNVITNLENGRRENIGLAEFLVLAAALDVPPVLLMAPVGRQQTVEILPDVNTTPWKTRGWLHGAVEPPYRGYSSSAWQTSRRALVLFDVHRLLIREHRQIERRIQRIAEHGHGPATGAGAEDSRFPRDLVLNYVFELADSAGRIRTHRALIASEGFELPDLPPDIAVQMREAPKGAHPRTDGPARATFDEDVRRAALRMLGGTAPGRGPDDDQEAER